MTPRQQAGEAQGYLFVFAENDRAQGVARIVDRNALAIRAQGQLFQRTSALHRLLLKRD
jgi:hypothetical protein